jgi:hypothetical protein
MKFKSGDVTDVGHCAALHHEFLRCHDAYSEFCALGYHNIANGENRQTAYRTYNAYARFIHHLYEFLVGALAREVLDTRIAPEQGKVTQIIERYIWGLTQRLLADKREAIMNSKLPNWENALETLPDTIPQDFPKHFRRYRNTVLGHVKHQRASLSMTEFYHRYHLYMFILYRHCYQHWGPHRQTEFPDLQEITDFSVMVRRAGGTCGDEESQTEANVPSS